MTNKVLSYEDGTKMEILAPIVHGEKGTHKDIIEKLKKDGFTKIRVNGTTYDIYDEITCDKNKKDDIDVVVDRIVLKDNERSRIFEAIETATKMANGKVVINLVGDKEIFF